VPKILFADGSMTVRKVAERLLTAEGFEVTCVSTVEEALKVLAKERPDLVISEVMMPDRSGYEVCRFVRSQPTLSKTSVLLISAVVDDAMARETESCQADGVLKKPFQGTALQDRVFELLAKQAASSPSATSHQMAAPKETAPVAAPALASAEISAAGPAGSGKVYRVTEEQLQTFRQAASRIRELEGLLVKEQERASRLAKEVNEKSPVDGRAEELERLLAKEREQTARLRATIQAIEKAAGLANTGLEEMARALAELGRLASQAGRGSSTGDSD
jgi:CheY-like chemotaxis protein